jgi:tetratricopeptide (TPR) repeat protein
LLELTRDEGGTVMHRNALTVQAMLAMAEGDYASALSPLERSVQICEETGSRWLLATSKLNLGLVRLHLRQLPEASQVLEEAVALYSDLGDERFVARVHAYRGHLALLEDDKVEAKRSFTEGLHRFTAVGDEGGIAESLEGLAATLAAEGLVDTAVLLWGAASQLREQTMSKTLPFERALLESWLDKTQSALGSHGWEALLAEGAAMDPEEAMDLIPP